MLKHSKHVRPGFNFIEMMVALVIIGIIVGMIGPRVMGLLGRGRKATTSNTLKVINNAIKEYKIDVGSFPETLDALIKRPENASNWQGPYGIDDDKVSAGIPKDGWDQDLVYKLNARGTMPPYELYSVGDPDKEDDRIYAK